MADPQPDTPDAPRIFIGSYVLESLTTGMYVEPRDALREYIQNAFDSIEYARHSGLVRPDQGRVVVLLDDTDGGTITIRDTGASIPPDLVWETLTSIGASRKSPKRQAGFRGIGRLAGIAYCSRLEFRCKAAGHKEEVTVTYDCKSIREALGEANDLESVFLTNVSSVRMTNPDAEVHFTEVKMVDTSEAPGVLKEIASIAPYLRSVAPVDFDDSFTFAKDIQAEAASREFALPTVEVVIGASEDSADRLSKHYLNNVVANNKASPIRKILYFDGGEIDGARWWGWYGDTALYGIINNQDVAGIRVRVKNIQLDGIDILSRIMRNSSTSKERFQSWLVGEIHIDTQPGVLIPNARRDGFEDSPGWRALEEQIRNAVDPVLTSAYTASTKRNSRKFKDVQDNAQREIAEIQTILDTTIVEETVQKSVGQKIKQVQGKLERLDLTNYSTEEQVEIRKASATLRALADRANVVLTAPRPPARPSAPKEPEYPAFLDAVFDVLSGLLDTRLFAKARRALIDRFK